MGFNNRVCQALHEEHCATIALMERLAQLIARYRRDAPSIEDVAAAALLRDLSSGIEAEILRHFAFEEERLFPFLEAIGEAIGAHLTDEHTVIRPIGRRLSGLAREMSAKGFEMASWKEFQRIGSELCERMVAHVQKEEMALLPLLEDNMDVETETQLVSEYLETA